MTTLPERLPPSILVDLLAKEIRRVDGSHSLGAAALAEALMPFVAALQAVPEGGEVVCYGLRRKGSTAIVGIIPNKVAQKPATLEWFRENYEEVPLRLAAPSPTAALQAGE